MYDIGRREIEAVRKVIESRRLFRYRRGRDAAETGKAQRTLARIIGARHCLLTTSGTAALICGLTGLKLGPGDEVIIPGYTFIASALAAVAVGAVPIIAEVDESLTIDPADVERKITRHTKAIMPVHMSGLPCNMSAIMRIARAHKLKVIEDACQADGGSYRGRRLGSMGHAGVLSFNYFKIITCGEGGALVTNDKEVYDRALTQHDGGNPFFMRASARPKEAFAGTNFRITEIQAAIVNVQLSRLDGILKRLRARSRAMLEILAKAETFRLSRVNDLQGACGTSIPIQFGSAAQAVAFVKANRKHVGMCRPIDTGRHVYWNWEAILHKRSHHPKMNPWKMAGRKINYSRRMCPQTLDILSRSVLIHVPWEASVAEARAAARRIVDSCS